ncbi:farnesyl pyrophosphate synthase [Sergentomyia squamirostris]
MVAVCCVLHSQYECKVFSEAKFGQWLNVREVSRINSQQQVHQLTSPKIISDESFHSKAKYKKFVSYLPDVLKDVEEKAVNVDPIEKGKRTVDMIAYQADGGQKYAGICTAETFQVLAPESMQSEENIRKAYILGWCVEFIIDCFNMIDDIIDRAETRRNKPCWYTLPENQKTAAYDAWILELTANYLLHKHFSQSDYFPRLQEMFTHTLYSTAMGQFLDTEAIQGGKELTSERYKLIADNISVYIAGVFPVLLGMTLAGYTDPSIIKRANPFLRELGHFYLVQDDYLDCFGDPEKNGTVGTDIQEGKCRWLAVTCYERATSAQREYFKLHYGKNNKESIEKIKQLYMEMNLPQIYDDYTNELNSRLLNWIDQEPDRKMQILYNKLREPIFDSNSNGGLFT